MVTCLFHKKVVSYILGDIRPFDWTGNISNDGLYHCTFATYSEYRQVDSQERRFVLEIKKNSSNK